MSGTLYICATPIGNLEDITLRALRILKEVDLIAAEDTRVTRKLLSHYGISTRLTSYHEHNEAKKAKELIQLLKIGTNIALVSDAGMPGISDPGHRLIKLCIEENLKIEPVPGPSSLITALVVSGLPTDSFLYHGFLPRRKSERATLLQSLMNSRYTIVLFESPNRIANTVDEIATIDPARTVVIARELTKKFEEVIRGSSADLAERLKHVGIKGEIVVVVGPSEKMAFEVNEDEVRREIDKYLKQGMSKKDAAILVSDKLKISKRAVYQIAIKP